MDLAIAVGAYGGKNGIINRFIELQNEVENGFNIAVNEEKITNREKLCQGNAPPLASITQIPNGYVGLGIILWWPIFPVVSRS